MTDSVKKSVYVDPAQAKWLDRNPGVNFSGMVRQVLDYVMEGGSIHHLREILEKNEHERGP